jgi:hypothetical protein
VAHLTEKALPIPDQNEADRPPRDWAANASNQARRPANGLSPDRALIARGRAIGVQVHPPRCDYLDDYGCLPHQAFFALAHTMSSHFKFCLKGVAHGSDQPVSRSGTKHRMGIRNEVQPDYLARGEHFACSGLVRLLQYPGLVPARGIQLARLLMCARRPSLR